MFIISFIYYVYIHFSRPRYSCVFCWTILLLLSCLFCFLYILYTRVYMHIFYIITYTEYVSFIFNLYNNNIIHNLLRVVWDPVHMRLILLLLLFFKCKKKIWNKGNLSIVMYCGTVVTRTIETHKLKSCLWKMGNKSQNVYLLYMKNIENRRMTVCECMGASFMFLGISMWVNNVQVHNKCLEIWVKKEMNESF